MKFDETAQGASIGRRIGGALLSIVVGWLFLVVIVVTYDVVRTLVTVGKFHWWANEIFVIPGSLLFVFVPGLFVFLPLYIFVPPNSFLWRVPICTSCGALFGGTVMFLMGLPHPFASSNVPFIVFAAITGGVICLFGSLTKSKFHYSSRPELSGAV